ncbi:ATP-dependent (S)-NAD(P)H-hydrate dehydratase-like [Zerene cesonia]|uniref:ATP-dependent (S)-NAD(P)H-hydrate dehydratase-like n=1 Tax=Zerene cesonia TaxID=33412 RepID=UPI0018E59053|nr:ATP-dependent (S)-NAD(P)H-hydrate dehydratase-like [Zerene cesonia]
MLFKQSLIGVILVCMNKLNSVSLLKVEQCSKTDTLNEETLQILSRSIIPELEGKHKGEAGKIAVIGGSSEYTGAPYFSAITALKVGADLVYVITTKEAAPVIKSYSPDLIVIPYPLDSNLIEILKRMHVIIIGPGLGRDPDVMDRFYSIIDMCRNLKKPLVIDADGLYAVYKNITVIKDYPSPGIIMTPNFIEAQRIKNAIPSEHIPWYSYWGDFVTVLLKGEMDQYKSGNASFDWTITKGGSGRRAGGQGDILSGALGTFFNWALKSNICDDKNSTMLIQSISTYAAAKFTRECNFKAYEKHGRSMLASDMLQEIHSVFESTFLE